MMRTANFPVLIVGAGPTGLALALTLRRHGVSVRLIDRAPAPATVSKALAVWSGSLEALASLGVVDEFLAAGVQLKSVTVGDGSRTLAALEAGKGIDSPYPKPLLLPQSRTEAILGARAEELGVKLERGVELTGFVQDEQGVTATLRHADGRDETVRARYVVGADGARSAVRQTLGIAFEGYTEPQTFILGDVQIEGGNLDRHSIYIWWHNGSTVALFPFEGNIWRIFAVRPEGEGDALPTIDELQLHMDRHGPPGTRLHDASWLSTFRTNERLAAQYRDGRVFLAGDAAHVHSPAGGQGMNTGIQDAVNLGWKLAYVLNGRGDAELLLDSYEAERRPVARNTIDGSAQRLHVAFAPNPMARVLRDIAVSVIGHLDVVQKKLQLQLSETDITYRDGPLVALGKPPRHAARTDVGTRALDARIAGQQDTLWPILSAGRHTLLMFGGDNNAALPDTVTALSGDDLALVRLGPDAEGNAAARYNMRAPGWVLIRPDKVVAARGGLSDFASLEHYLARVVSANGLN
jgi:2-polyprenyl-6-methoxyphenol hydroxylase-like FAD-dependent oxidoreductase